jgi:hypothetical protein
MMPACPRGERRREKGEREEKRGKGREDDTWAPHVKGPTIFFNVNVKWILQFF